MLELFNLVLEQFGEIAFVKWTLILTIFFVLCQYLSQAIYNVAVNIYKLIKLIKKGKTSEEEMDETTNENENEKEQ